MTPCYRCRAPLTEVEQYRLNGETACGLCFEEWHSGDPTGLPYYCKTHRHPCWSPDGPYPDCEVEAR